MGRRPWSWLVRTAAVLALILLAVPAAAEGGDGPGSSAQGPAQPTTSPVAPFAVPAARAAKNVWVITIRDEIDEWTDRSVRRRIAEAEAAGADAIVFDLDTPGGNGLAMLAISGAIKKSRVNTVAWVNPNAYSAGAIIALACKEIVIADSAALGDALPVAISQLMGVQPLPDAEREKFLGPIMADLVDSARRNKRDEVLVQGFVRRGVELWLIERIDKPEQRLFVTAEQFELAVGRPPTRSTPRVPSITGPVGTPPRPLGGEARKGDQAAGPTEDGVGFIPGAPNVSKQLISEVNEQLALRGHRSERPDLSTPEHLGKYREVEYVADGHGVLTLRNDELIRFGIAAQHVRNDAELKGFFGAGSLTRADESWSEKLARFLSALPVKGVLVVIFIIAIFVEMTHPGLILPGAIAALALLALVVPPMLVNMNAWWMLAAILAGVALIAAELFVFPGVMVCGVTGALLLLAGLVGAVLGGPGSGLGGGGDGRYAVATFLLSMLAAAGGIWTISRYLPHLPVFNRLVLGNDDESSTAGLLSAMESSRGPLKRGSAGVAITPLRPAGRVQVGETIYDVVADVGFVPAGAKVRVVSADEFRVTVEMVHEPDAGAQEA